jgi:DNA-binding NtrC family response regulator
MGKGRNILVSWVSIQHAAAPLLTVIENTEPRICGRIDRVVLCHRVNPRDTSDAEALAKTLAQLEALPERLRPEIELRPWRTTARPTDHRKILEFSKALLLDLRRDHPLATVYLHLSPGTKAMHAAWLILAHGAFIHGVHLLQTREDRFRDPRDGAARPASLIERVSLPRETWGHFVRASAPAVKDDDDDGVLWDPSRVESPRGKETLKAVARWAPLPVPILLIGERGTGKTSLAHVIRARSGFMALGKRPWPVVVCGQFRANPELARSELFGHARGAFTGASADREGVLEVVQNDTLFLDEVADLDRGTQRLLMAALEGRPFQRLGESTNRVANFRLLAATNRPLHRLVPTAGTDAGAPPLDEDFFDRISTFIIEIPPLRERREDLPLLWRSSLGRAARRLDLGDGHDDALRSLGADKQVLAALAEHQLPGNIRDLHRAAWRGVAALMDGAARAEIAREAIAGLDVPRGTRARGFSLDVEERPALPVDLDARLDAAQRNYLLAAMEAAGGNKAEAARLLGLPRKTFEYRLGQAAPDETSTRQR